MYRETAQAERLGDARHRAIPTCIEETSVRVMAERTALSNPHVYGGSVADAVSNTYALAPSSTRVGSNILSDGDPQASCLTLLVLACDTNVASPFIPSPVSHRRGRLVTEAFYASTCRRSASRRILIAALRSRSITAWQCSHLYTRSFRVSLVSGRSPQLLQVCEDG